MSAEPVTAEYFIKTAGVDPGTAASLAQQHNEIAGLKAAPSTSMPVEQKPWTPPATPSNPRATAALEARMAEFKAMGVDSDTARSYAQQEAAYERGSGIDRSVMISALEQGHIESQVSNAIDKHMEPPKSPHEYLLPESPDSAEANQANNEVKLFMFEAGVPREIGNRLAQLVADTGKFLSTANEQSQSSYFTQQEETARNVLGSQFDARVSAVKEYLREQCSRSPALKRFIGNYPEAFSGWETLVTLANFVDSQRRLSLK